MHISLDSALGRQRRLNSVGESITQIAPDPAAAYSLRSLTGGDPKVVRVRRSNDNSEQDFTVSEINSGALVSFVGSGNDGFVQTWYDQSGNGNDATQTSASLQPKIVNGGTLVTDTSIGQPSLLYDATNLSLTRTSFSATQPVTDFSVTNQTTSGSSFNFIYSINSFSHVSLRFSSGTPSAFAGAFLTNSVDTRNSATLIYNLFNGASSEVGINGASAVTGNVGTNTTTGSLDVGSSFEGTFTELIIYNSDQSANRLAIETNINGHYSIF
jgi:hypothetical protein